MTPPYRIRKLARFAAPFGGAVMLCCAFSAAAPVCAGVCAAGILLLLLFRRGKLPFLLPLMGGLAGAAWFLLWTALFVAPADTLAGTTTEATGTVLSFPEETSSGVSVEVELDSGITALLYLEGECDAAPGDTLQFTASFRRSNLMYGEDTSYYSARGVFLLAYGDGEDATALPAEKTSLRFLPALLSEKLKGSLDSLFSSGHAALLRAMILGDKTRLDGGISSSFRRAGLSHVLVVSGLHLSVLLSFLRLMMGNRRRRCFLPILPM